MILPLWLNGRAALSYIKSKAQVEGSIPSKGFLFFQ